MNVILTQYIYILNSNFFLQLLVTKTRHVKKILENTGVYMKFYRRFTLMTIKNLMATSRL